MKSIKIIKKKYIIYADISNENQNNQGNLLRDRESMFQKKKQNLLKKAIQGLGR